MESYYLWSDTEYDQVFDEAAKALTVEGRFAKYDQLEKILAQESPLMPLSFAKRSQLVHPFVKGRYENAYDVHPWKGIYLEATKWHDIRINRWKKDCELGRMRYVES